MDLTLHTPAAFAPNQPCWLPGVSLLHSWPQVFAGLVTRDHLLVLLRQALSMPQSGAAPAVMPYEALRRNPLADRRRAAALDPLLHISQVRALPWQQLRPCNRCRESCDVGPFLSAVTCSPMVTPCSTSPRYRSYHASGLTAHLGLAGSCSMTHESRGPACCTPRMCLTPLLYISNVLLCTHFDDVDGLP